MTCGEGSVLFGSVDAVRRERLAAGEIVVDLFCGGGGATQGIEDAGLVVHECVNHCPTAIATHERNHPGTNHRRGDVWKNTPAAVAAGRPVGLLWASPDCRHFSRARGAAPVSRRVRDLAWVVTRWAKEPAPTSPRVIIVENVPELVTWGPVRARVDERGRAVLDAQGRPVMEPIPERKGETFRRWVNLLKRCGYSVEWRVLDAADYGAASRRKRLYVIARRDGAAIEWPEVTHGEVHDPRSGPADRDGGQRRRTGPRGADVRGRGHQGDGHRRRSAADVIDWSDLGTSLFDRRKPLADKTLARIAEGIKRYVLNDPRPFVLRVTQTGEGSGWKVSGADAPLPTQTTRQDLAVVSPVLATTGYGEREGQRPRCSSVEGLLGTCVDGVKQGLVSPVLAVCAHGDGHDGTKRWGRGALPIDGPLNAIHAGGNNFGLIAPLLAHNTTHHTGGPIDGSVPTVTTGGNTGLVSPVLMVARNHADGSPVDEPLRTVAAGGQHHGLIAPCLVAFYGSEQGGRAIGQPVGTVTTRDRHGLSTGVLASVIDAAELVLARARRCAALMWYLAGVQPGPDGLVWVDMGGEPRLLVDILFRMLKPRELAAAMGFPASYVWPATQREAVRLIGNAVSPPQAAALVRAVLPGGMDRGGVGERAEVAA